MCVSRLIISERRKVFEKRVYHRRCADSAVSDDGWIELRRENVQNIETTLYKHLAQQHKYQRSL